MSFFSNLLKIVKINFVSVMSVATELKNDI